MSSTYAGKTIIQIAQARGSSAKTRPGAWKYLLAHLPGPDRPRCSDAYRHEVWAENRWRRRAEGRARILGYDLDDPNTPGRVADRQAEHERQLEQDRHLSVRRNEYGQLLLIPADRSEEPRPDVAVVRAGLALVARAAQSGVIESAYNHISWDHRSRAEGKALHHDLYDAAPHAAIVCLRHTTGSRYGVATKSKTYLLLTQSEEGEIAAQSLTAPIAKYAKLPSTQLGEMIAHCRGEHILSLASPAIEGYKAVALTEDGSYRSVWDQSEWPIGRTRIERVQYAHGGGYYYYRDLTTLVEAARKNEIFGEARNHRRLAILAVRADGRQIAYSGGKYAATRLTVLAHIGSIL